MKTYDSLPHSVANGCWNDYRWTLTTPAIDRIEPLEQRSPRTSTSSNGERDTTVFLLQFQSRRIGIELREILQGHRMLIVGIVIS